MTTIDPSDGPRPKPRKRHGLGADGIDALRSRQDGKCAICRRPETDAPGGRLAVDHDHAHCPGKIGCPDCVRGLLCVNCNNLLRSARDDQRILGAAIEYIAGPAASKPRAEDLPITALIRRWRHGGPADPRLMPRQGRRDRFFMMLLDAPAAAATVAEAGWMLDNDPHGYRVVMGRADESTADPARSTPTSRPSCHRPPRTRAARPSSSEGAGRARGTLGMSRSGVRPGEPTLGLTLTVPGAPMRPRRRRVEWTGSRISAR